MPADFYLADDDTGSTVQETVTDASGTALACSAASLYLRHMATGREVGPFAMVVSGGSSNVLTYRFLATELVDAEAAPLYGGWWYQIKATSGGRIVHIPNDRGQWKMLEHAEVIA